MCAYRIPSTPCTLQGNTKSKKRFKQNSGVLSYQFLPGNGTQTARRKVPPQKLFCIFFEHLEGRLEELVQIRRSCTQGLCHQMSGLNKQLVFIKRFSSLRSLIAVSTCIGCIAKMTPDFSDMQFGYARHMLPYVAFILWSIYIYTWYICIYTYMSINSAPGKTWCNIQYHTWAQQATSYYNMITSLYSKMLSRSLNSDTTDRSNMVTHRNRL